MPYNLVLVSAAQQCECEQCQLCVTIHTVPPEPVSYHPHPIPLCYHRASRWGFHVRQQLPTIYFTHGNVYMSVLTHPMLPPPYMFRSPFSMSASLFLPRKLVHQYHFFSRSYISVSIYDIFFSLWHISLCMTN